MKSVMCAVALVFVVAFLTHVPVALALEDSQKAMLARLYDDVYEQTYTQAIFAASEEGVDQTPAATIRNPNLVEAGNWLRMAAKLGYAQSAIGVVSAAIAPTGSSDSDSAAGVSLGLSAVSLGLGIFSPNVIGEGGKSLRFESDDYSLRQAGLALEKHRSTYNVGLKTALFGLAGTIIAARATESPEAVLGGLAVTAGGAVYSAVVPPWHLGAAGSYLSTAHSKVGGLSPRQTEHIQKAGSHLKNASALKYASLLTSIVGGGLIEAWS